FTGRYPYILVNEERSHDGFETELRADEVIFPEYLKAAGYLIGHVGKSHIGTASFIRAFGENCAPWNRWAPPIWDDADYQAYLKTLDVKPPKFVRKIQGKKPDRQTLGNLYGGWVGQEDGKPFPVDATYPHYLVTRAMNQLERLLDKRKPGQPVYFQIDLFAPHQPFFIPSDLAEREKSLRQKMSLPASYEKWVTNDYRWDEPQPKIYEIYRRNWGLYDQKTAFDYFIAGILQMEVVDLALNRFLRFLKEEGLLEKCVFLLTSDHGEMNLEQGLIDKGVYGHPRIARVPLLLKLPGFSSARVVEEPVCLLDVAPTMFNLAGIEALAGLDGESLLVRLEQPSVRRKPFLFEATWHVAPNPAVAIHDYQGSEKHYRYVYNLCSEIDELYDLNDPESKNLIAEPGLTNVLKEMREQLLDFLNHDVRWRCYLHAFRLDHFQSVKNGTDDTQMFVPE
ncbi:MAG: sulfatase-like hydrolase/transferase, partial [Candidatus Omnitrophica bacterium]|nr:sulfatase-like hydrolase/transferase [Candidatus Omnitrophota bacterium]